MGEKKRVLVTGASGLIGGLVIKHLGHKYELSGLSRRPVEGIPHLVADVADAEAIAPAFAGMDAVLHLAADTSEAVMTEWEGTMRTTVQGTLNVFQAAHAAHVPRVVFMSSGSTMCGWEWYEGSPYGMLARGEYDRLPEGWEMLDYRDPPRPDSPYAVGKLFGENCGRYFSDRLGMSVLCIRLGAVLPDDKPALLRHFPGYLAQADAVQMIEKCIDAPLSLRFDIFDAISENTVRWRDTSHAKSVLGWRPVGSSDNFNPDDYRK